MEKIIDLHIHTNCSDGSLSPKEVIDMAKKNNVSILAIADHDTIDAYSNELYEYAKKNSIKIINAVEISTKIRGIGIHILGYNFDINNEKLKKELSKLKNSRHKYLNMVSKKLNTLGYIVNVTALDSLETVTKAHIALDILNNQNNRNILLKVFKHIPTKGEFIENIMNEGCPAYVKKESISPKKAAELIKQAGGKTVLAHPVAYKYEDNLNDDDILSIIETAHIDGIESIYIYVDKKQNKINEIKKWTDFGIKHDLFITVGSDFHIKDGIHPEIGLINESLNLNKDLIKEIVNNILY